MVGDVSGLPLLSILIALPLVAGIACLFVGANAARWTALVTTLAALAIGIWMWTAFVPGGPQWQFVEFVPMGGGINWALGIDGIALMLTMLTLFLMPICIGASWNSIEKRVPEYMAAFLLMEALMIGVFAAQDLFLFYVFFEGGLIPMYLIIGIWGGAERIKASYKFFLYTLLGSVLMLIAMIYMVSTSGKPVRRACSLSSSRRTPCTLTRSYSRVTLVTRQAMSTPGSSRKVCSANALSFPPLQLSATLVTSAWPAWRRAVLFAA